MLAFTKSCHFWARLHCNSSHFNRDWYSSSSPQKSNVNFSFALLSSYSSAFLHPDDLFLYFSSILLHALFFFLVFLDCFDGNGSKGFLGVLIEWKLTPFSSLMYKQNLRRFQILDFFSVIENLLYWNSGCMKLSERNSNMKETGDLGMLEFSSI